jgi:hypothetical protein
VRPDCHRSYIIAARLFGPGPISTNPGPIRTNSLPVLIRAAFYIEEFISKLSLLHNCTNEESYFYLKSYFHKEKLKRSSEADFVIKGQIFTYYFII